MSFCVSSRGQEANNKESIQFFAAKSLTSAFLSNLGGDSDQLGDYESPSSHTINLTALSIVSGPKSPTDEGKSNAGSTTQSGPSTETTDSALRPCLVCGVSVSSSTSSNLRTRENVWAASADLAPSSSLVRAMNSVNSAASDSLDIMKVAGDRSSPSRNHYLVLYDFHHKAPTTQPCKEDATKSGKTKKTLSGTGTSASSNGGRQESLYQEVYMSKFLYDMPVIEDVDCEMVGGTHFDGMFQTATLPTSSNPVSSHLSYHTTPFSMSSAPNFDANFNPINTSEQFPSTSDISGINKKPTVTTTSPKADPVVVQTVSIEAPSSLRIAHVAPTKDGRHLYVSLCPTAEAASAEAPSASNANQMDIDEESEIFSPKSLERMYWDHNGAASEKLINGEIHNDATASALLLVYELDFTGKVVKLVPEPVVRRELSADQAPIEHVFLPLQDKHRATSSLDDSAAQTSRDPRGQIALVCADGVVRLLDLASLKTLTEARPIDRGTKFISAAYCNSLERLCVCSSDGDLNFFCTTEEEDSAEEKEDADDVNMITEGGAGSSETEAPGTSSSSAAYQVGECRYVRNVASATRRFSGLIF